MKKKMKSLRIGILVMVLLFSFLCGGFGQVKANAATVNIVHHGFATYVRSCGIFTVNGEVAFCMEHEKATPRGETAAESNPYDNDLIKTILYYGWGGPGNIFSDRNEGIVRTSFALSYVYTGDTSPSHDNPSLPTGYDLGKPLLDYANAHLISDMTIAFSKTSIEGEFISEGLFQTETVTVNGDSRNKLTFSVPSTVTVHNETTGASGTGSVTVKGGDKIHFTSTTGKEDVVIKDLVGSMGYCQALLLKTSDSNTQNLGKLGWLDPPKKANLTVTWDDTPRIGTKASDAQTNGNQGHVAKMVTIKDEVSYINLIPGKSYTVKGILMDKATGQPFLVNGEQVTAEKTFTPEKTTGSVIMEFVFDGSALESKQVVAFEKVYEDGKEVAAHEDINDDDQTVTYPKVTIGTTAHDTETDINEAFPSTTTVLKDIVSYKNLIAGESYTLQGILMDKTTGQPLLVNGSQVVSEKTFTANASEGSVAVEFSLDSSSLSGKDLVVFEQLSYNGSVIAVHQDIEDEGQTIRFKNIKIHTIAKETESQNNEAFPKDYMVIEDEVSYSDLIPGWEYTFKGILMDKATGQPLLINGNQVVSEKTFTAEAADGSITMTFELDASHLAGHDLVVFEKLFYGEREIASHEDLSDSGQTIAVKDVKVYTTAKDKETDLNEAYVNEKTVLEDLVSYKNLIAGKEYTVKGILMDKATGKPLLIDGKEVTAEKTFTAEAANGSVTMTFELDSTSLIGKKVVVFEKLFYGEREIAAHEDLEDEGQTVIFKEIGIGTTARDKKTKTNTGYVARKTTIIDEVSYKNLIIGKEYTVKGILMDKATGKPYLVDGKEVTAETTFIAETADGTVEVEFVFNGSGLVDKSVVVFEKLYYEGREIAAHEDLEDAEQTVTYEVKKTITVETGDNNNIALYVLLMTGAVGTIIFLEQKVRKIRAKLDIL